MIVARGLGRSGTRPGYLTTAGLGFGTFVIEAPEPPLATLTTLELELGLSTLELDQAFEWLTPAKLRIEVQPFVSDFVVQGPSLVLQVEALALSTISTEQGALEVNESPIQTDVQTDDEERVVAMQDPLFELPSIDHDLSLTTEEPDLVLESTTDDLEVLDEDQPLLMDLDAFELLLSTTPLEGSG